MNQTIRKRIEDINNGIVPEGYKQTPFGIFPCDWETISLGDLLDFKNGVNADKEKYNSGVKMISVMDILADGPIYYDKIRGQVDIDENTLNTYSVTYGDILFQRSSETFEDAGKSNVYLDCDKTATYSGFVIRGKKKAEYNPYFLNESLKISQVREQIIRNAAGSQHINVGQESLEKIIVPSALSAEQGKITEILMKWDEMVELQEQYIQKLELRKKAIMKKLLTPKDGWEKCRLNELVYKEKGKALKIDNEGSIPIVDMEYLDKGVFTNYTNEKGVLANEQDILLLWDGASAGTLLTGVKGVVGSTFALLTLKNDKTSSKYLYYWLTIENDKNASLREGSGIPHMPKDYLQKQVVKYPILDKQIKISKTLALLEEEISLQKEKLEKIKIQRKAMQQYLLTGIVRIG